MRFSVGVTKNDEDSWWLYGDNEEKVAWAGETFDSKANAQRAAEAFRDGAASAEYDVYEDKALEWRWRAWRSSDKVASSGEAFDSKANAERAAANVRDNAGTAEGL